jgi:hypothetical protein
MTVTDKEKKIENKRTDKKCSIRINILRNTKNKMEKVKVKLKNRVNTIRRSLRNQVQ